MMVDKYNITKILLGLAHFESKRNRVLFKKKWILVINKEKDLNCVNEIKKYLIYKDEIKKCWTIVKNKNIVK